MRGDLLSKRLFIAGCFGLPWLWVVHVLYHRQDDKGGDEDDNEGGILNADDHFPEESAAAQQQPPRQPLLSPEQIKLEMEKWVRRCHYGAVISISAFVAWIVIAQVLRGSVLPRQLYFIRPDNADITGW